jgi:redox-sensitive bicupin YhaK (pirin superfamily)
LSPRLQRTDGVVETRAWSDSSPYICLMQEENDDPVVRESDPKRPFALIEGRSTDVGGIEVRRLLPRPARRTIGAWCFLDHLGPVDRLGPPVSIGPHPHIGLQTVTWLLEGEVRHTDSLGNDVTIVPGELNLMTAGVGVAHAEQGTGSTPTTHGVQLWIAQPSSTRFGGADFAHHPKLPSRPIDDLEATVLIGSFGDIDSPATVATPTVGVEIAGSGRASLPLDASFEYAVIVLSGAAAIDGNPIPSGTLADLGSGRSGARLDMSPDAHTLILGGVPFGETLVMWWNFVARTRDEIIDAWSGWTNGGARFAPVESPLPRIETGPPSWMTQ